MPTRFRRYDPEQPLLLPPDLREWLPDNHLAHHIRDIVERLNLSAFYVPYAGDGRRNMPYDPAMIVQVLLYAYATGVVGVVAQDCPAFARGRRISVFGGGEFSVASYDLRVSSSSSVGFQSVVCRGAADCSADGCGEGWQDCGGWHQSACECEQAQGDELRVYETRACAFTGSD